VCDGLAVVLAVVRSPQFHEYFRLSPSASVVPALFPTQIVKELHVAVNVTDGAVLPAGSLIVTSRVVEADLPHPSVVVSVIV
jgi:hypothetical protein